MGESQEFAKPSQFIDERSPFRDWSFKCNISNFAALINLTKAAIAVGFMKLPHHVKATGLLWPALAILLSISISLLATNVMIRTQEKVARDNGEEYICFPDVVKLLMDNGAPCCRWASLYMRNAIIMFIILFHIIICAIYVNYVSYKSVFFFGSNDSLREIVEVAMIAPLVIVCFLVWRVNHLTYVSALGDIILACSLLLIIYLISTDEDESKALCLSEVSSQKLLELPSIMGASFFGAHNFGVIIIVHGHMKNRQAFLRPWGVLNQMYAIVFLFMAVAVVQGCFRIASVSDFPDASDGEEKTWRAILRVLNSVIIFLSIPIHFQVCTEFTGHFFYYRLPENYPLLVINYIVRFTYILIIVILALFIPTIVGFYPLFGNCLIAIGAVLLPALVEFIYVKNEEKNWMYYKTVVIDSILMTMGLIYFALGVFVEIYPSSSIDTYSRQELRVT